MDYFEVLLPYFRSAPDWVEFSSSSLKFSELSKGLLYNIALKKFFTELPLKENVSAKTTHWNNCSMYIWCDYTLYMFFLAWNGRSLLFQHSGLHSMHCIYEIHQHWGMEFPQGYS